MGTMADGESSDERKILKFGPIKKNQRAEALTQPEAIDRRRNEKILQARIGGLAELDNEFDIGPIAAREIHLRFARGRRLTQDAQAIAPLLVQMGFAELSWIF